MADEDRGIVTVRDLQLYLERCPPDALVWLMPETGEGLAIRDVLKFDTPPEVWILIDEFGEYDEDPPNVNIESETTPSSSSCQTPENKVDVIKVRGKLRSA